MAVTKRDLDWVAARLLPDIYDIRQRDKYNRVTGHLKNLLREVDTPEMNIRLRELSEWREKQAEEKQNTVAPAINLAPAPKTEVLRSMSITGLQGGAFQAALTQLKQRMADKQNSAVASIAAGMAAGESKIDAAVSGVTAKIDAEVSEALQEFSTFTNGGPA
jgi:hypothetical protein